MICAYRHTNNNWIMSFNFCFLTSKEVLMFGILEIGYQYWYWISNIRLEKYGISVSGKKFILAKPWLRFNLFANIVKWKVGSTRSENKLAYDYLHVCIVWHHSMWEHIWVTSTFTFYEWNSWCSNLLWTTTMI